MLCQRYAPYFSNILISTYSYLHLNFNQCQLSSAEQKHLKTSQVSPLPTLPPLRCYGQDNLADSGLRGAPVRSISQTVPLQ